MQASVRIAFKEWAVVVETLGRGEQILILRKGGIRENRGEFGVDHSRFWLFPTLYHEAEQGIIPSKRPALQEIAARMSSESVDLKFLVEVDSALKISQMSTLRLLQGRHIWRESVLAQRFEFGREPGLHALIVRVFELAQAQPVPVLEKYGGCKSWIELDSSIDGEVTPVLTDAAFAAQRNEICELLSTHALAHS